MIYRTEKKINTNNCEKVAIELREILENGQDVIIDLSETEYISSSGLRVILIGFKTFRAKGYDFSIVNPSESIKEILNVTGLLNILLINDQDKKLVKKERN